MVVAGGVAQALMLPLIGFCGDLRPPHAAAAGTAALGPDDDGAVDLDRA